MGSQKDSIEERAKALGLDSGDSSHQADHMRSLAEQVGMSDYNSMSNADTDELDRRLRELEQQRQQQPQMSQHERNVQNNANNVRNAADVAMATKNPYAMGAGAAVKAADKVTGGKSSEAIGKALERNLKHQPFGKRLQKASNKLNESGASDAIGKSASMKNGKGDNISNFFGSKKKNTDKGVSDASGSGEGSAALNSFIKKGSWKWILLASCCLFVIVFFVALISAVYDLRTAAVILGEMSAEDRKMIKDTIVEIEKSETGLGGEVGMGSKYDDIYYERINALGNVFSSEVKCEKEDCSNRPEVRYFLKVADIALRYKNKYHVNLDWVLLNATIMFSDADEEETMARAIHDYDLDAVEDYDILMDLDWDYDYKKIPGYIYLSPDDFRYDLQILAKNMVTKSTTQTCTKTTTDADGNKKTEITKDQHNDDIEDAYLQPGAQYYLKCADGEEYSITSTYRYDAEKYDEFLLEYIEKKYYMPSNTGIDPTTGETDMTPSSASGDYIFPLPSGATSCRSSAYGPRIHPITGKYNNHSGDDYPAAGGTAVYAVKDGKVTAAAYGYNYGMGNYVQIDHGNGITSIYMHASQLYVEPGQEVKQGDVIMAVGTTGSSTGNHLHITFKKNGVQDNPANYIGALPMC